MTVLLLIRHAQNDWVKKGKLAGWTPGVHLNNAGMKQAEALGTRLATAKLDAVYSSPLERAVETAQAIVRHHQGLTVQIDSGVGEVNFGNWTGKKLKNLAQKKLWRVVQNVPSRARFPEGESFLEMQFRVVSALESIASQYPGGTVAVTSHSDVIKAVVAYYAGMHIDMFQRLVISPASISIIGLEKYGPRIIQINDTSHYSKWNKPG